MKRLLAAVLAVILVAGCSNPPHHGRVIDRGYSLGHYNYWTTQDCMSYRKNGTCSLYITVHHQYWVDPSWSLELRADVDDTEHDKTGWITVTQDTYVRYPVGSTYP